MCFFCVSSIEGSSAQSARVCKQWSLVGSRPLPVYLCFVPEIIHLAAQKTKTNNKNKQQKHQQKQKLTNKQKAKKKEMQKKKTVTGLLSKQVHSICTKSVCA